MDPNEVCNKHDDCMNNIQDSIHKIELHNVKSQEAMDGFVKSVDEFLSATRKDIYSRDGLMDRVGNHNMQLALQWGLMATIVLAVIINVVINTQ